MTPLLTTQEQSLALAIFASLYSASGDGPYKATFLWESFVEEARRRDVEPWRYAHQLLLTPPLEVDRLVKLKESFLQSL